MSVWQIKSTVSGKRSVLCRRRQKCLQKRQGRAECVKNDYPEVRKLLKELINEVNRIGININQIVFNNNAGLYSKEDKTQLVAYMRKLNKKVNEAVVKIGNQ